MDKESALEEKLKETKKEIDKAFQPSRGTQIALGCALLFVVVVSVLHGINEAWAWEVAKALITIDGLVLGFAILGATSLTRRASVAYKTMMEEAIDKFLERYPESKESLKKIRQGLVDGRMMPFILEPSYRLGHITGSFETAITQIMVSVGFSVCLFGVSDTLVQDPLIKLLFFMIYYLSIAFFITGVYSVMNVTFTLVRLSVTSESLDVFDTLWRICEKKAKEIEGEEKSGKRKKGE